MAVSMTAFWNNVGTVIPGGDAEYVVAEQPIAEYDNWFNYNIVADIQAVIDDVINKFNANTILKADTDNTPAALVIAEQTIVGRKTGSSIAALTATEVRTILNVENGSTADQTGAEIKSAYEAEANAYTDTKNTKLAGIATGAEVNLFEEVTNVLREKSAGGYDNDFVIGSPQLADDGNTAHDNRIWFDKSKGSFRAGTVTGSEWDDSNVGTGSCAIGDNVVASGNFSCALGDEAAASGQYAHAIGYRPSAYMYGHYAHASGYFSANGDAQHSTLVLRRETTSATQSTLTMSGTSPVGTNVPVIPANRTWAFTANIAARQTAGIGTIGDSGIYKIEGGIKRDGANNTTLVGVITKTVLAKDQSAWDVTAEADNSNEWLVIKVTGEASKTIHWVAKVDLVEVG